MNLNQLDRILKHFRATYIEPIKQIRVNEKTGIDLLAAIAPPRKMFIQNDSCGESRIVYDNAVFLHNPSLLDCEVEIVGTENAAKYFADEFYDGDILKVEANNG